MEAHLRAGIAIYNAGQYHAAHDAWEDHWLALESGTDDEVFLHGLIQFTAAIYHARNRNWAGATGLAVSAREYLAPLSGTYRGVNVDAVRSALATLATDPEVIERRRPLMLTHDGEALGYDSLGFEATCIASVVLAEELGYDESVLERATTYARQDLDAGQTESPFVTFVFDFVREPKQRDIIVTRLREHVERRQHRDDDVAGLFADRESSEQQQK